jgi:hypothetical protein
MRTWQQRLRVALIAAASFVLLVTVLPELASGLGFRSLENRLAGTNAMGCSGSSGGSGSSSTCPPQQGTVTGSVFVIGGPKGFSPAVLGAEACPGSGSTTCANPVSTVAASNGAYTLSLTAGSWTVFGFYEITSGSPAFLGTPANESVPGGGTVHVNLGVPYVKPATLAGTITVTNPSSNDPIKKLTVVVCPSAVAFSGGTVPSGCASRSVKPSPKGSATAPYSVPNLPAGSWTAYPGFCARSGCVTHTGNKQTVTLTKGKTTTLNLSTPFLLFGQALLYGTVTVTGAPSGFEATLGVNASQIGPSEVATTNPHGKYALVLTNAIPAVTVWSVKGFYVVPGTSTEVNGPASPVVAVTGASIQRNLSVPFRAS